MNGNYLQKPTKQVFMTDEEIQEELTQMESDSSINTKPAYDKYDHSPEKLLTFRDRHSDYLKKHPKVNPQHYLSNLRAVLRVRSK